MSRQQQVPLASSSAPSSSSSTAFPSSGDGSLASGRKNPDRPNLRKLSHGLSWLLRHGAVEMGLHLSRDGFAPVDEVLECLGRRQGKPASGGVPRGLWTVQDVRDVVETSDKRRFKLEERRASEFYPDCRGMEHDRWILCIRANQGHSIEGILDPNLLLTQLSPTELVAVPMIVHGTYEAAWDNNIQTHGLSCMGRNHIHFATGLPTPRKRGEGSTKDTALDVSTSRQSVTSGIRRSCQIYIYIDAKKCVRDGIVFYRSDNGVLLTNGINGTLPVACFSHVTTASGSILLDQREKPRSGNHI